MLIKVLIPTIYPIELILIQGNLNYNESRLPPKAKSIINSLKN
jgi:hypothetical protein